MSTATSPEERLSAVSPSATLKEPRPPVLVQPDVVARVAEFAELSATSAEGPAAPIDRLLDVTVTVTAELGRVGLPISSVLNLNVNSVLELNRLVSEPVDLMVQGVRLARGEVVVVGDSFGVRIKEIVDPKKRSA